MILCNSCKTENFDDIGYEVNSDFQVTKIWCDKCGSRDIT